MSPYFSYLSLLGVVAFGRPHAFAEEQMYCRSPLAPHIGMAPRPSGSQPACPLGESYYMVVIFLFRSGFSFDKEFAIK